jgi:hypothetical protein
MAKMFYTMDETKAALGRSEDQIKALASEGRLREFRDGQRLMFKADQVEHLKGELAGGSQLLDLAADDSGLALSSDEPAPSGSTGGLPMAELASGGSTAGGIPTPSAKDDTALASDLGLSGSVAGLPSSGRGSSGSSSGSSASNASKSGIDIFQTDENEQQADPSAATSIAPGINPDQISIESVGSGSGLLDLTNERDDTSLGAELLDEIAPGASGVRRPPGEGSVAGSAMGASGLTGSGTGVGMAEPRGSALAARSNVPAVVEAPDPLAPAFGLAALGAACVVLFAAFAVMCGLAGSHPDILMKMGGTRPGDFNFMIVAALTLALPALLFAGGFIYGKMGKK